MGAAWWVWRPDSEKWEKRGGPSKGDEKGLTPSSRSVTKPQNYHHHAPASPARPALSSHLTSTCILCPLGHARRDPAAPFLHFTPAHGVQLILHLAALSEEERINTRASVAQRLFYLKTLCCPLVLGPDTPQSAYMGCAKTWHGLNRHNFPTSTAVCCHLYMHYRNKFQPRYVCVVSKNSHA